MLALHAFLCLLASANNLRVGIFAVGLESAFCGFGSSKSLKTLVPGAKINLFHVILDIKIDGDCIFGSIRPFKTAVTS